MKLFKFMLIALTALALLSIPAEAATDATDGDKVAMPPAVQTLMEESDFCRSCR